MYLAVGRLDLGTRRGIPVREILLDQSVDLAGNHQTIGDAETGRLCVCASRHHAGKATTQNCAKQHLPAEPSSQNQDAHATLDDGSLAWLNRGGGRVPESGIPLSTPCSHGRCGPRSYQCDAAIAGGATRDSASSLDEALSAAVARGDVPGLVVMAATRDRILYQGAFGKAEVGRERPMTADAIFRIASMTKPVTSVAAMQLYEQGRFALDDPAEKYLPELANLMVFESFDHATGAYKVRPAAKKVTIRHLFTHTSGLGYGFTSPIVRDFKPRDGEKYEAGPLLFEPGTQWIYGTSVDWVGRLVEKLSGKNLEEYFRERIFTPLGMSDTFYNVPEAKQARLVTVHQRQDGRADAPLIEQPNQPQRPATTFNGGGGLSSTASDYIRFERMILNGGTLDGARILSADTVALMAQEPNRRCWRSRGEDRTAGRSAWTSRSSTTGRTSGDSDSSSRRVTWPASGRRAA